MQWNIIGKAKWWYGISLSLLLAGLVSVILFGLKFGIDFTGGSLLEIRFDGMERPASPVITQVLQDLALDGLEARTIGDQGAVLHFKQTDEETHQKVLKTLRAKFLPPVQDKTLPQDEKKSLDEMNPQNIDKASNNEPSLKTVSSTSKIEEARFESIGPSIGQELQYKTLWALFLATIGIILYIAWVFRKVSFPISSWKYGLIAVIALIHDILITIGFFTIVGKIFGFEVDIPFIAALLTILGYSVNDTIVVFDRIRENLLHQREDFEVLVNNAVNQTFSRSLNTSLTTVLTLFAVLIFGGVTLRSFVLALIVGIVSGTYSSIFIASPLLVTWHKYSILRNSS